LKYKLHLTIINKRTNRLAAAVYGPCTPLSVRTIIMLRSLFTFLGSSEHILGYYLKIGHDRFSLQPFILIILSYFPILHYIVYVAEKALLKNYESKPLKALII
jgi:hypothetical protein